MNGQKTWQRGQVAIEIRFDGHHLLGVGEEESMEREVALLA